MESLILFACGLWNAMWPCRRGRRRQSASRRCVIEWDRDCGWAMDTFFVALFVLPLCGVRHWIAECFSMLIVDVFSRGNDYIIRWLMRRVRFVTDSRVVHVNRWMSLWVAHKRRTRTCDGEELLADRPISVVTLIEMKVKIIELRSIWTGFFSFLHFISLWTYSVRLHNTHGTITSFICYFVNGICQSIACCAPNVEHIDWIHLVAEIITHPNATRERQQQRKHTLIGINGAGAGSNCFDIHDVHINTTQEVCFFTTQEY